MTTFNQNEPGRDAEGPDRAARREQVAREMRGYQVERLASEGQVRVRGRAVGLAKAPDKAALAHALTTYADEVRLWVENGASLVCMIRSEGQTVEKMAARMGVSRYSVLVCVLAYDAHHRGLFVAEAPLTRVQAEIAMGVRDFDGEYRGVFAELVDEFCRRTGEDRGSL